MPMTYRIDSAARMLVIVAEGSLQQEERLDLMRSLCASFALKSARGRGKVIIIDDADDLNEESANCFLKTLEEPPPRSVLILIGSSPERQLPTMVVRLFNTVGPRQTGRYGMVLPRFVRQAMANEALTVYGEGTQQRCFWHDGQTSSRAGQKPSAPSPTASFGGILTPRAFKSWRTPRHDCSLSRSPSAKASSSFVPSARAPTTTSRHGRSSLRRTLQ